MALRIANTLPVYLQSTANHSHHHVGTAVFLMIMGVLAVLSWGSPTPDAAYHINNGD